MPKIIDFDSYLILCFGKICFAISAMTPERPSLLALADDAGQSSTDEDSPFVPNPRRAKWIDRISAHGPWDGSTDPLSLRGAPSLPMPVEVSNKASLVPFFEHISVQMAHTKPPPYYDTDFLDFKKAVLYADGRVDLCKMATGPTNIGDLMDSLQSNHFAKHFLPGNNIIGSTGAKAIADFVKGKPDQFETWYLAGNFIDTASFSILVDAMIESKVITNFWLKRNPLMAKSAMDVFRLIEHSPVLRTLDLDQTELGDDGVAQLFRLLAKYEKPIALRHIYLTAVGIGARACQPISDYLCSPHCALESLYIPLRYSVPVSKLIELHNDSHSNHAASTTTQFTFSRLYQAIHLSRLLTSVRPTLLKDLGMRFNWITDASATALENVIRANNLQYLIISYTPMTQTALKSIYDAVLSSQSILWFHVAPLVKGGKS
ncbi:hypothetical protein AC579_992 [Pseudocercospora musae]|nr:hypothetical protein AC579_992 [Pseudocercospora musae]